MKYNESYFNTLSLGESDEPRRKRKRIGGSGDEYDGVLAWHPNYDERGESRCRFVLLKDREGRTVVNAEGIHYKNPDGRSMQFRPSPEMREELVALRAYLHTQYRGDAGWLNFASRRRTCAYILDDEVRPMLNGSTRTVNLTKNSWGFLGRARRLGIDLFDGRHVIDYKATKPTKYSAARAIEYDIDWDVEAVAGIPSYCDIDLLDVNHQSDYSIRKAFENAIPDVYQNFRETYVPYR